nr:VanW family protein [Eubacterium sp.]
RFITTNARGRNIKKAVNRLAGKMLDPGEEMSFLNVLYDDSDGEIYEESGGFLENQVVQVEGGGICQVSTTAYGAFLRAGIIPVERHPHTCRVPYAPMGLDAALAIGTKDMVIKNTLKQPIFIQAYVKKQWLYINIISTKNATKGYTYIPRVKADKKNLTAESFLDVKKKGKKIKTIKLSEDSYKKVSG